MKRIGTIATVAASAALVFAAQAFAFGGGMGGGQMGGSMGGGHQMSSGMQGTSGAGMHQGAMNGTGAQGMMQGGVGTTATMPSGQLSGSGMAATKTPKTTTIK
jgi:hypothetical protein